MHAHHRMIFALSLLLGAETATFAAPSPYVVKAADGIFVAFGTHPLVALGEWHGLAQEEDFYGSLIRDPRFASEVGNVVLETGDAAQQNVIDRYVNGEDVPYAELRKVWADTVGWFPAVTDIGSINVYATVRAVNMTLPPERRIKIWLGEPPIDWSQIKTKADWQRLDSQRDNNPAALIEKEILEKGKKALVIYGVGHLGVYPGYENIRAIVESVHPGSLFIVSPYVGYATKACATQFERHIKSWPSPSLVGPIKGSSLEPDIFHPGCGPFVRPSDVTEAQYETAQRNNLGLTSDALLYLGPRNSLITSGKYPDLYLDLDFRAELERRSKIRSGQPVDGYTPLTNSAVPKLYWAN